MRKSDACTQSVHASLDDRTVQQSCGRLRQQVPQAATAFLRTRVPTAASPESNSQAAAGSGTGGAPVTLKLVVPNVSGGKPKSPLPSTPTKGLVKAVLANSNNWLEEVPAPTAWKVTVASWRGVPGGVGEVGELHSRHVAGRYHRWCSVEIVRCGDGHIGHREHRRIEAELHAAAYQRPTRQVVDVDGQRDAVADAQGDRARVAPGDRTGRSCERHTEQQCE